MGAGALVGCCSVETAFAIGASTATIASKSYEIYKNRKRSNSEPITKKVLLPPIRPKKIRTISE